MGIEGKKIPWYGNGVLFLGLGFYKLMGTENKARRPSPWNWDLTDYVIYIMVMSKGEIQGCIQPIVFLFFLSEIKKL